MRKAAVFLSILAFASGFSFSRVASAHPKEPDYQSWMQALVRANLDGIAEGLRVEMDMQVRRLNLPLYYPDPSDPSVAVQSPNTLILLRPYVGYQFRHNMTAWVGYAYQPDLFDDPEMRAARNIHEHRVFTQFTIDDKFGEGGRLELGTRVRMEHRVRTHGPGSPSNDGGLSSWAHRFRLFERFAVRIKPERPWFAVAYSETFFHLNETRYPSKPGFDQQRTFGGVALKFNEGQNRIELGYLNQFVKRYTDPHWISHVVLMSAVVSFRAN